MKQAKGVVLAFYRKLNSSNSQAFYKISLIKTLIKVQVKNICTLP